MSLWVPHDEKVYVRAKVLKENLISGFVVVQPIDELTGFELLKSETHAVDPSHLLDLDDLCNMNNLHEAPLLDIIRRRLVKDLIYTYIGNFLISLNPYRGITGLYDNPLSYWNIDGTAANLSCPHVFAVANNALCELICGGMSADNGIFKSNKTFGRILKPKNQSIIITGESGAGKTEASKHVMTFLTLTNNQTQGHAENSQTLGDQIKQLILQSNSIFESFGNAKTVRNSNSSRFGKYIKLEYSADNRLMSAYTETFLLERSRLTSIGRNERNYHIFYRIIRGLANQDPEVGRSLGITSIDDFNILVDDGNKEASSVDDIAEDLKEFELLGQAMNTIGCSRDELDRLWEVIACLLHLGNTRCVQGKEDLDPVMFESPSMLLDRVSELLGIERQAFVNSLGRQRLNVQTPGRKSLNYRNLTSIEAQNNISALIKYLYRSVFSWLVRKVNYAHGSVKATAAEEPSKFIGILDIFGFEILQTNSFEQLCINYTNERLQQQFNEHVFISEQQKYASEGLDPSVIKFRDNQHVIDLISRRPTGLLIVLEEHSMLNRKPDDAALLSTYNQTHFKFHEAYIKPRFGSEAFIIKHFAGEVGYQIAGFIGKNNDSLQVDVMELFQQSGNVFLRNAITGLTMFTETVAQVAGKAEPGYVPLRRQSVGGGSMGAMGSGGDGGSPPPVSNKRESGKRESMSKRFAALTTVSYNFRNQLDLLINSLRDTEPHYIKCIKPNTLKTAGVFDAQLVMQQLRYSGVLEVVRIRREGFPSRASFIDFYKKYHLLAHGRGWPSPADCSLEQAKDFSLQLIREYLPEDSFQVGTNFIFLTSESPDVMQKAEDFFLSCRAVIAQAAGRRFLARRALLRAYKRILLLQSVWRKQRARRTFKHAMKMILTMQRYAARWRLIKRLAEIHELSVQMRRNKSANLLQAVYRGHRVRCWYGEHKRRVLTAQITTAVLQRRRVCQRRYRLMRASLLIIQKTAKMFLWVRWFRRMLTSCITIQRIARGFLGRCRATRTAEERLRRMQELQLNSEKLQLLVSSRWRMIQARSRFFGIKAAVRRVIRFIRNAQYQRLYEKKQRAASVIRAFISPKLRQKFFRKKMRSVRYIQRAVRFFIEKKGTEIRNRAAVKLQAWVRCRRCRNRYLRSLLAILTIQKQMQDFRFRLQVSQFHAACRLGDVEKLRQQQQKQQLSGWPSLRAVRNRHMHFCSPMQSAALGGHEEVLRELVMSMEHVFHTDSQHARLLHYAVQSLNLNTVKYLSAQVQQLSSELVEDGVKEDNLLPESGKHKDAAQKILFSGQPILKSGWLRKLKPSMIGLRPKVNRWFVLTADYLTYFNTESDLLPHGFVVLKGCTIVRSKRAKKACIEISASPAMTKRSWLKQKTVESLSISFPSEEEFQTWFSLLRQAAGVSRFRSTGVNYHNVELLRAWVNQVNVRGENPLHVVASMSASADQAGLLAQYAKPKASFTEGSARVELETKLSQHQLRMAAWLIEAGCALNAPSRAGVSPLQMAVTQQRAALAGLLLRRGADRAALSKGEQAALDAMITTTMRAAKPQNRLVVSSGTTNTTQQSCLLPRPIANNIYSYLSVKIGKLQFSDQTALDCESLQLDMVMLNAKQQQGEAVQSLSNATATGLDFIAWDQTWHIQTPIENLDEGASLLVSVGQGAAGSVAHFVHCCGSLRVDKQTLDSGPAVIELALGDCPPSHKGKGATDAAVAAGAGAGAAGGGGDGGFGTLMVELLVTKKFFYSSIDKVLESKFSNRTAEEVSLTTREGTSTHQRGSHAQHGKTTNGVKAALKWAQIEESKELSGPDFSPRRVRPKSSAGGTVPTVESEYFAMEAAVSGAEKTQKRGSVFDVATVYGSHSDDNTQEETEECISYFASPFTSQKGTGSVSGGGGDGESNSFNSSHRNSPDL